jgi:hypothetical protein
VKKTHLVIGVLVFAGLSRAAEPTGGEMASALQAAVRDWGVSLTDGIDFVAEATNSCELKRNTPVILAQTGFRDVSTRMFDEETGEDFGGSGQRVLEIRVNSNCDWNKVSLQQIILHLYGQLLLGPDYSTGDHHSIMYKFANLKSQRITKRDRAALMAAVSQRGR